MEVIEFPGTPMEEKIEIARRFLIPRQVDLNGLGDHIPRFSEKTLINPDSGVHLRQPECAIWSAKSAVSAAKPPGVKLRRKSH
jgi:ATP-dependent Lon protease